MIKMARNRRGLGKGKGMGYRNIIGKDPAVHSQSARGMKQPQRVSELKLRYNDPHITPYSDNLVVMKGYLLETKEDLKRMPEFVTIKFQEPSVDSDGDGFPDFVDCRPFNPYYQRDEVVKEVGEILSDLSEPATSAFSKFAQKAGKTALGVAKKTGKTALELAKKGEEFAEEKISEFKEEREKRKIEEFADVSHPVATDIKKQEERLSEIESHINTTEDSGERERLFDELIKEREELRQLRDKFTEIGVEELSDEKLKKLAIRFKDDSIIFVKDNPYRRELLRRIEARKNLEKDLKEARSEKPDEGLF